MGEVYETLTISESTGLLLRDLLIPRDSYALKVTYSVLDTSASALTEQEWLEAGYDFNVLFAGPQTLETPPFVSVHFEEDTLVMGEPTLSTREFMADIGLSIDHVNNVPGGHTFCILESAALLSASARIPAGYQIIMTRYIIEYIAMWVPVYMERTHINIQTVMLKNVTERLSFWPGELNTRVSI